MIATMLAWLVVLLLALAGLVAAVLASQDRFARFAALPIVPVGLCALLVGFGGLPPLATPLPGVASLLVAAIGVLGGGPLAALVLRMATGASPGAHGGIIVATDEKPVELLRGGAVVGYLERLGTVAAIGIGYPEGLAVVVAVKGLGRFSELQGPEVRERFIVGTLTSLIWAAVCGTIAAIGLAAR